MDLTESFFAASYYYQFVLKTTGTPGYCISPSFSAVIKNLTGLKGVTVFKDAFSFLDKKPVELFNWPIFLVRLSSVTIHTTYILLGGVSFSAGARLATFTSID